MLAPHKYILVIALISAALVSCGGGTGATAPSTPPLPVHYEFAEVSQSPDTGAHQGYATDGTVHFMFDTAGVQRRADAAWNLLKSNSQPFNGLTGYNHLGDGDYFEGKLYVVGEYYKSCDEHSQASLFIFDSNSLERTQVVDWSADGTEMSSVAVNADTRELWVSSFCDFDHIRVYDLDTFAFKRSITLNPSIRAIQGIAARDGSAYLADTYGGLYRMSSDGSTMLVYRTNLKEAEHEGIDYSQNDLRWLIDAGATEKRVHMLRKQ